MPVLLNTSFNENEPIVMTPEPRYHRLISEFEQRTGVPVLLNTSFNENEPIVMSPGTPSTPS